MLTFAHYLVYISLFCSLYFETFLLITYFEKRLDIKSETEKMKKRTVKKFPTVGIIVPCWNEEKTLARTIHSLLKLDYPKDKLKIVIVDDGSTDGTLSEAQKFTRFKQVEVYHKENGGKHTAVNFGLEKIGTDFVGCMDADSFIHKDALKYIMSYFDDKEVMAVTPSIKVWRPEGIIQLIQNVEYGWGIFTRKVFSYIGALYVTPGPGSIFRKEVFEKIGGFRQAYLTEDSEMALRMQSNHMKIVNSHDAVVYTVVPDTLKKLYKQRLRWTYGFLNNALDYKFLFFKKKYGNLGILILPMATISILTAVYIVSVSVFNFTQKLHSMYVKFETVGLTFKWPSGNIDWFSFNTEFLAVISLMAFMGTITIILISRKMSEGKIQIRRDLIYFLVLYTFMAPIWLGKAVFNALFSVKTTWR